MKSILKFVFPGFCLGVVFDSLWKSCVHCAVFHMEGNGYDPQLYFPLFVLTKTGVVIRKLLCGLLGVDGPMWSRKHFRIIDWKMI